MDPAEIEVILREEWARGGAAGNGTGSEVGAECGTAASPWRREQKKGGRHDRVNGTDRCGDRDRGLTKRFGGQTAVDGLSLSVPRGSIFGLIGENGAGKTTTIQMLLGLMKPSSGRVDVLGLDPSERGLDVRRRVGYVPEVAGALRLDDGERDRLVRGRVSPRRGRVHDRLSVPLQRVDPRVRPAGAEEDQGPLQGHAGQGVAVAGAGVGPGAAWSSTSRPPGSTCW